MSELLTTSGAAPQGASRGPGRLRLVRNADPSNDSLVDKRRPSDAIGTGAETASDVVATLRFNDTRCEALFKALTAPGGVDVGDSDAVGIRALVWRGVTHPALRPFAWRVLLGYPSTAGIPDPAMQARSLARRAAEYQDYINAYFAPRGNTGGGAAPAAPSSSKSTSHQLGERLLQEHAILRQIELDMPRHSLGVYHSQRLRPRIERALFVWSVRHPATSYVQGFDDFMALFFSVFVCERLAQAFVLRRAAAHRADLLRDGGGHRGVGGGFIRRTSSFDLQASANVPAADAPGHSTTSSGALTKFTSIAQQIASVYSVSLWGKAGELAYANDGLESGAQLDATLQSIDNQRTELGTDADVLMDAAERDAFYCAGAVLEWLQEQYLYGMPGVHLTMRQIDYVARAQDPVFVEALEAQGMVLQAFLYPWVHSFLIRLVPPDLGPRLFDTYLAIGESCPRFLVYMCAALLLSTKHKLIAAPLEVMQQVLQRPTLVRGSNVAVDPKHDAFRAVPTLAWLDTLIAEAYLLQLKHPKLPLG